MESSPRLPWWRTLHVRLAAMINLIAVAVLAVFWVVDYRRELGAHIAVETGRLREEARVLRVAQRRADDREDFQRFLDEFCEQMGVTASPGHHIAIFDDDGDVWARAHERADPRLEAAMRAVEAPEGRFGFAGQEYLAVQAPADRSERIVIAQSLRPIHEIIGAQALSRAASLALLAVLVFAGTTLFVLGWVRDPLNRLIRGVRAIERREFGTRVEVKGSAELQFLARGVNEMAGALDAAEKARLAQMQRARAIQRRLLPRDGDAGQPIKLDAVFVPAESVGGDLYDVVALPDGATLLAVLDVSGHGVAAALYTALLRAVLRGKTETTSDLSTIAATMNDELCGVTGNTGEFATCMLVRIAPGSRLIEYVGAGHEPGVIVRSDRTAELLNSESLPLGVRAGEQYATLSASLDVNENLFLYTDGLHEVFDAAGVRFGRGRLVKLLRDASVSQSQAPLDEVVHAVRRFADGSKLDDDVTLLRVRRRAPQ